MNNIEKSAVLLAHPIIGDGQRFTYVLKPENQFLLLDGEKNISGAPFVRVEANGTGLHCGWMITESFVVIRRKSGAYISKSRPPIDSSFGAIAYSNVFGFSSDTEDFIIFSSRQATYVVRVSEEDLNEETLVLGAICYCGYASVGDEYYLLGQTFRNDSGAYGEAVTISVADNHVKIEKAMFTLPLHIDAEAAVATFLIEDSRFVVYAKQPKPGLENNLEFQGTTLKSEHSEFLICELNKKEPLFLELKDVFFVNCVGPIGKEVPFFCVANPTQQEDNLLLSVDTNLNIVSCQTENSKASKSIINMIYDKRVGYLALVELYDTKDEQAFALSRDGKMWEFRQLLL